MKQWIALALLMVGLSSPAFAIEFPAVSKEAFKKANALYDEQEVKTRASAGLNGTTPENAFVRVIFDEKGELYSDEDYYANLSDIPPDAYYMTSVAAFADVTGIQVAHEMMVMSRTIAGNKRIFLYDLYAKDLQPKP